MSSVSFLLRLRGEGGVKGLLVIASSALGIGVGLLGLPLPTIGLFMSSLHRFRAGGRGAGRVHHGRPSDRDHVHGPAL